MATTLSVYNHTHKILCGAGDWTTHTFKLSLVGGYYFTATDTIFGDYAGYEGDPGDGYTTGGATLTGLTKSNTTLDANDVGWTALTKTFNAGLLYISGTVEGLVDPLMACITFDTVNDNVIVTNENFNVLWNASGIFTL